VWSVRTRSRPALVTYRPLSESYRERNDYALLKELWSTAPARSQNIRIWLTPPQVGGTMRISVVSVFT
jgi:hypothetical protein